MCVCLCMPNLVTLLFTICRAACYCFLKSSSPFSVPQKWSMRSPAWTSHLLGRVAVSHRSVLWDSGPTSQPVCSNYPVSQPCTRKCSVEVREMRSRLPRLEQWKAVSGLWREMSMEIMSFKYICVAYMVRTIVQKQQFLNRSQKV